MRHASPNPTRKLVSIGHFYVLGVNRRLTHELQRQSNGKWEVSVVAPDYFLGKNVIRENRYAPEPDESVHAYPIKAHYSSNIHLFYYERQLIKILGQGFDLVHAWEEPYIAAGFQIARSVTKDVPFVYRSAQSLPKRYPAPFNWMESFCTRRMNGWMFSGSFPVIGYIGWFVHAKGLNVIIRAFGAARIPDRLLLVSNGPMLSEIQSWAKKRSDSVRIVPTSSTAM